VETSITQSLIPALSNATERQFTDEQINIIKNSVAKGVSDEELDYFLEVCRSTGLNPLHRQIYAIMRKSKNKEGKWQQSMTIQTGIDGYRLLATRSRRHAGTDDAIFDTETATHPTRATVTVYRLVGGQRCPFVATARWSEYAQTYKDSAGVEHLSGLWEKMPYLLLGKCAEALALRKAFPAETSGIYTHEEMDQADSVVVVEQAQQPPVTPSPEAVVLSRIQEFQEIVDSTNPRAEQRIPLEPTEEDWKALKARIYRAKMATTIEGFQKLMQETGGDYEETVARLEKHEARSMPAAQKRPAKVG
jgi:phage recombination protein Bet